MRKWLIKLLVGKKPVIANVTLKIDEVIRASEPEVFFYQSGIDYSERFKNENKRGE